MIVSDYRVRCDSCAAMHQGGADTAKALAAAHRAGWTSYYETTLHRAGAVKSADRRDLCPDCTKAVNGGAA